MQKTITIFGREYQSKDGGKSFISYSYTPDGEKFFKVKFKKECEMTPKKIGYVDITFNTEDVSKQKGKILPNGVKENDTLWYANVTSLKYRDDLNEEARQRKVEEVNALFE